MEPEKQIPCPFVTAQKLLAGKWSILILHLLHGRTLRFGQLQKQMPKIPPKVEYSVSQIGEAFYPVLDSLEAFGNAYTQWQKQQADEEKPETL